MHICEDWGSRGWGVDYEDGAFIESGRYGFDRWWRLARLGEDETEEAKKEWKSTLLPIASMMPVNMMLGYGMRQYIETVSI